MVHRLLVLALLVLPILVLLVPTANIWMPKASVYNAAHVFAPEVARASTFVNTTDAYVMCQHFVRQRLRTQTPVRFPGINDVTMFTRANYLTVIGHVDAQRGFGAPTRRSYTCNVRPAPSGQWRLVSLHLFQ
jgi:hypothetical protein